MCQLRRHSFSVNVFVSFGGSIKLSPYINPYPQRCGIRKHSFMYKNLPFVKMH